MRFMEECNFNVRRNELGQNIGISEEEREKREWFFFKMRELNASRVSPATTNRENTQ